MDLSFRQGLQRKEGRACKNMLCPPVGRSGILLNFKNKVLEYAPFSIIFDMTDFQDFCSVSAVDTPIVVTASLYFEEQGIVGLLPSLP